MYHSPLCAVVSLNLTCGSMTFESTPVVRTSVEKSWNFVILIILMENGMKPEKVGQATST